MESNHFNYFRVKNFKRFKDLEVNDIGQFNLILGDNNVGKTSLLEALMIDKNSNSFINSLIRRLEKRRIGEELTDGVIGLYINNDSKLYGDESYCSFLFDSEKVEYVFDKVSKKVYLSPSDGAWHLEKFLEGNAMDKKPYEIENPQKLIVPGDFFEPLISNLHGHSHELTKQYSKLIQSKSISAREKFIDDLKLIDESISSVSIETISSDKPLLTIESTKYSSSVLMALFGDGTIAFFTALLFLYLFRDRRLMIDEVDAGIYHSRMKEYWKMMLETALKNNVQIFATTHNQECIKAYYEALDELGSEFQDKARVISLVEHQKTKEVSSVTFNFEEFEHSLLAGNEIR